MSERKPILTQSSIPIGANPWYHLGFKWTDIFDGPLGLVEGAMAAIQTQTNNYYCSRNVTAARQNLQSMSNYLALNDINDAVTQFYQFMQRSSSIVINCGNSVLNAAVPNLLGGTYFGENLVQNLLYNLGFQITDVLDLVFVDPTATDPFWYYVFFRVGDFMIRFVYADTS